MEEAITRKYDSIELLCEIALKHGDIYLAESYVTSLPSLQKYQSLQNRIKEEKSRIQDTTTRNRQNKLRLQFLLLAIVALIIVGYSEIYEQKQLAQLNALRADEETQLAIQRLNDIQTLSESHRSKKLLQETEKFVARTSRKHSSHRSMVERC